MASILKKIKSSEKLKSSHDGVKAVLPSPSPAPHKGVAVGGSDKDSERLNKGNVHEEIVRVVDDAFAILEKAAKRVVKDFGKKGGELDASMLLDQAQHLFNSTSRDRPFTSFWEAKDLSLQPGTSGDIVTRVVAGRGIPKAPHTQSGLVKPANKTDGSVSPSALLINNPSTSCAFPLVAGATEVPTTSQQGGATPLRRIEEEEALKELVRGALRSVMFENPAVGPAIVNVIESKSASSVKLNQSNFSGADPSAPPATPSIVEFWRREHVDRLYPSLSQTHIKCECSHHHHPPLANETTPSQDGKKEQKSEGNSVGPDKPHCKMLLIVPIQSGDDSFLDAACVEELRKAMGTCDCQMFTCQKDSGLTPNVPLCCHVESELVGPNGETFTSACPIACSQPLDAGGNGPHFVWMVLDEVWAQFKESFVTGSVRVAVAEFCPSLLQEVSSAFQNKLVCTLPTPVRRAGALVAGIMSVRSAINRMLTGD